MDNDFFEKMHKFQKMYDECSNIVFFGGAGVSTESGIPDFRSIDGLYYQQWKYPPEQILSHTFFEQNTKEFFRFYRQKLINPKAKPNKAHFALAKMEEKGKLKAVVTQNIDGLHQAAGSKKVYELHGSIMRNYCTKCKKSFPVDFIAKGNENEIPFCECGSIVKPDVVLYEESLNDKVINESVNAVKNADLLIIGGTSLIVYPAASFINYFAGKYLVVINKSLTSANTIANLSFQDPIGKVLENLKI